MKMVYVLLYICGMCVKIYEKIPATKNTSTGWEKRWTTSALDKNYELIKIAELAAFESFAFSESLVWSTWGMIFI